MKRARRAKLRPIEKPVDKTGPLSAVRKYHYFMIQPVALGMLKCPVNINFVKVIVFITKTVFATWGFVVLATAHGLSAGRRA
jgi:hypothetical protein